MAFDRNKYKATSLAKINSTVSAAKQAAPFFDGGSSRAPFYNNVDGVVTKRVLPAHIPGNSPYVPLYTAMLPCEVDDKDVNGNVVGKKIVNKKVFLATIHGKYPYDIIEEYIRRVYEQANEYQDKNERSRFLNPITGYRMGGAGGKWVSGIKPKLEYVFYALIDGKIYRDSLTPKQMEALNKESADLCSQSDQVAVDMFSDPTTGFPIRWDRHKDANGKNVDDVRSMPLRIGQDWASFFEEYAVPDSVLQNLEKLESLEDMYVNSYKLKDFELALDGLKRFDEKNQYKIFAQDDFLDMVEKLQAMVEAREEAKPVAASNDLPFDKPAAEPAPAKKAVAKKPVAKKTVPVKKAEPTPEEKLAAVNEEFKRQYGDGYEDLELSGSDLDEAYALAIKHQDLGYDIPHVDGWNSEPQATPEPQAAPEPEPAPAEEPAVAPEVQSSKSGQLAIERIRAMREARQKNAAKK